MCFSIGQAAKAGNLAYVKALLLQGLDPNETDNTGQYTPIMAAAFLAHIQVRWLAWNGSFWWYSTMAVCLVGQLVWWCSKFGGIAVGGTVGLVVQ